MRAATLDYILTTPCEEQDEFLRTLRDGYDIFGDEYLESFIEYFVGEEQRYFQ